MSLPRLPSAGLRGGEADEAISSFDSRILISRVIRLTGDCFAHGVYPELVEGFACNDINY